MELVTFFFISKLHKFAKNNNYKWLINPNAYMKIQILIRKKDLTASKE